MSLVRFARQMALAGVVALPLAAAHASPATPPPATRDTAIFAGGCFWGIQAVFERVKGVITATSGYAGGKASRPSYEDVSTGTTGYAESVQVIYDPSRVTYDQLLEVFFAVGLDPTELNYQGPDHGTQYRSAIFFRTAGQQHAAQAYIAKLTAQKTYSRPIVTEVTALNAFYPAESYHQGYFDAHPDQGYIVVNDKPKVDNLKRQFPQLYTGK